MTERRYNDDEVAAIFLTAAEGPKTPELQASRTEGLTLAELQEIGREVGISPGAVAEAAKSLELRGRGRSQKFLGLPIGVERTVALNRWVSDEEWERMVVELREVFHAPGTVRSYGSLRQWTNGNLHALLEPTPTGHRLRLGSMKGNARAFMRTGLFVTGVGVAVAIATAFSGNVVHAIPGFGMLMLVGLGMFTSGALQLPGWARLRARQMEDIATRHALPAGSAPEAGAT